MLQKALGRWTLQGLFVELRFQAVRVVEGGNPSYEALYLLGYARKAGKYVLHLFDTFGVTSRHVPGIGARDRNRIRFEFAYDAGRFVHEFTWHPERRTWTLVPTYEADGATGVFAKKEMTPA